MSFTMDDVMEVLQIVKECKDAELHIESGDLKLSIVKGNVGDSGRSPLNSGRTGISSASQASQAAPAPQALPPDMGDIAEVTAAPMICGTAPGAVKEEISIEGLVPVKASVTSVFYRRPSPNEPPFVEVGNEVKEDTVLCLLEVMKCFRQVTADVKGVIEKICVESNHFVEQGTTLFLIRPI
jgi:acetyl-CoA carboxylase biotin carboxyl carrier protein